MEKLNSILGSVCRYIHTDKAKAGGICCRHKTPYIACAVGVAVLSTCVASRVFYPLPVPVALKKLKRNLGYFCNPADIWAMLVFKFTVSLPSLPELDEKVWDCGAWDWTYQKLVQTSRSFTAVILELDAELREPDDMAPTVELKIKELRSFYTHLREDGWNIKGFGEKPHEIDLLENFHIVIAALKNLKPKYLDVITDICQRMGNGMADFLEKDVETREDWDLYCHYVAGLVGYGLSGLFAASGLEDEVLGTESFHKLSNSMGLFLQKTNIIRDILEDASEQPPRLFWPKDIWGIYIKDDIQNMFQWENRHEALKALNHMVTEAIHHAADCLDYLKVIKDKTVFKFCAIPQVMAIATLELCYNNYDVFQYEVKIRKGETVRLILESKDYKCVVARFLAYAKKFKAKIPKSDPNAEIINNRISALIERCESDLKDE